VVADEAWRDPHVHAEAGIVDRGRIRAVLTQVVGRAPVLATTVTTACRERRPVALTSVLPERVTCLACRESARESHLRAAGQLESMASLPAVGTDHRRWLRQRALEHRDLARRFG
jgi:hypothetical protein